MGTASSSHAWMGMTQTTTRARAPAPGSRHGSEPQRLPPSLTAGSAEPLSRRQGVERRNSLSASIAQESTPLRAQRQNPPPLPPSTTNRTTSGLRTVTERQNSPRRPPRAGTATRLQAAARTAQTAMRLHPWAQQNHRCSKPQQLLPSRVRSA